MAASEPLVSIIIPTYNRADLIGETLDSILAQTHKNWEAIVVDDGSSDTTDTLMETYMQKDVRIQYFKRPSKFPKGGNVCRNIGLENMKGDFVVFFDSDDLMTEDHVRLKLDGFTQEDIDFVVTKTAYFNKPTDKKDHTYNFDRFPITLNNYLAQRINWLTLDACIKASVVREIRFNEDLKAGQEFNFYAKLLARTTRGYFIPKVVSLRRYHEDSIQAKLRSTSQKRIRSFESKWNTYQDLKDQLSFNEKKTLLYGCIKLVIKIKRVPNNYSLAFTNEIFKVYGLAGFYFIALLLLIPFNRGYVFHKKLRSRSIS